MDLNQLKQLVLNIINRTQPTESIIQNLSKTEVDLVSKFIEMIGYQTLKKAVSSKPFNYKIEGVESTGHIPEDHPERQLVIEHINKLVTLPNDHPHKEVALNVAKMLQERHLGGQKVIHDVQPKTPTPTAPGPAIDYSKQVNPPPKHEEGRTINYGDMNQVKQQEPAATLTYDKGQPSITVHSKK